MHMTIPAGTTMERYGEALPALLDWLQANQIEVSYVSGAEPLEITGERIEWFDRRFAAVSGRSFVPVTVPMPEDLLGYLAARFGCVYGEGDVRPDNSAHRLPPDDEAASLDDIAPLIDQLRAARSDAKAVKEREDEAKLEILARLKATNREYGTVAGQRVVHAKSVTSNTFQTVAFRQAHPELAAEFTQPKTSIRLEIV